MHEFIREDEFHPSPFGPTFKLEMWETGRRANTGQWVLGYRLSVDGTPLFEAEDFGCSPMFAVDSEQAAYSLMGFLCLQPGGTDREFFDRYTPRQMRFAQDQASDLMLEVECTYRCAAREAGVVFDDEMQAA